MKEIVEEVIQTLTFLSVSTFKPKNKIRWPHGSTHHGCVKRRQGEWGGQFKSLRYFLLWSLTSLWQALSSPPPAPLGESAEKGMRGERNERIRRMNSQTGQTPRQKGKRSKPRPLVFLQEPKNIHPLPAWHFHCLFLHMLRESCRCGLTHA